MKKKTSIICLSLLAIVAVFAVWNGINTYKVTGCIDFFQKARPLFEEMPRGQSFTAEEIEYECSWDKGNIVIILSSCLLVLVLIVFGRPSKQPSAKELAEDKYELSGKVQRFSLLTCENCGYKRLIFCFGRIGQKFGRILMDTYTQIKCCKNCRLIYQRNPEGYIHIIKEKWWEGHCKSLEEFLENVEDRISNADIEELHEDFDKKTKCFCGGELVEYKYQECINCHTKIPKKVHLTQI